MQIQFFDKQTGGTVLTGDYFILNGDEVWCDNYESCESSFIAVGFEDFITQCPNIGWRIVGDVQ